MPDVPDHERDIEPIRRVHVMPRLSAPIDEGTFYPHPKPTVWDKAVRIAIFAVVTIVVVAAGLTRGAFLK